MTFVESLGGTGIIAVEAFPVNRAEEGMRIATGESLVTALLLLGAGVLTAVAGLLARRGKLPRNWFLGIRTSSTLKSDEAWRAAHRAAGSLIVVAGLAFGATGVVALLADPSDAVVIAGSGIAVVALLIAAVLGVRATKKT